MIFLQSSVLPEEGILSDGVDPIQVGCVVGIHYSRIHPFPNDATIGLIPRIGEHLYHASPLWSVQYISVMR